MNSRSLEERLHPCSSCGEVPGTGPHVEQRRPSVPAGWAEGIQRKELSGEKKMTSDSMCNEESEST